MARICENKYLKTIYKACKNNKHNNSTIIQYFRTFIYYAKARSNVYIFAFATLISLILGSHGFANVNPIVASSVVIASYFMALATYIYNDVTDFELDKINKTNRPSVTGKATEKQLVIIVSVLNAIALLLVFFINFYALFISIIFIALGIAYSHPKLNLKDKFPLKTVVTAAGAGLLSFLGGTASLVTTNGNYYDNNLYSLMPLPITTYAALFFFAFFFILGPLGDIGDLEGDRAVGRRTFPIVIGIRSTMLVMISIPVTIMLMTMLLVYDCNNNNKQIGHDIVVGSGSPSSHGIVRINQSGIYLIIGTCLTTLVLILRINKKANDVLAIKSTRPKMRFLHIMLQISLLLAFI
ncbi:MAG: UbiA family prenyltransferase [Nitrososphaeraceae archaeon]|nr:UbiA family prenyltransferase [Nitrososphaeraceae archaeon]